MGLTHEDLLRTLEAEGIDILNNASTAGRMPPGASCGLHPVEFFCVYNNGGLMEEFRAQLPPPMPTPSYAFNTAANTASQNFSQIIEPAQAIEFNPRLLS